MPESLLHFEDLLRQLAAEHDREVDELRAEVARLRAEGKERDSSLMPLATAFAAASEMRASKGETIMPEDDPYKVDEGMILWRELVAVAKSQLGDDMPKVHMTWNEEARTDLGFKMKNLVVGKRDYSMAAIPLMSEADSTGSDERAPRFSCRRLCVPTFPLHPSSKMRLSWDLMGILMLTHDLIMIPMLFYNSETTRLPSEYLAFLDGLDLFAAGFWTLDIFMNFNTGIYAKEGYLDMRMDSIAKQYLKTWLAMDVAIVSIDWIMTFLNQGGASDFMRLGKTASRFMRVVRLLRFAKMNKYMAEILVRINSEYVLTVIGLIKHLVVIVIINHYIACCWFGLSQMPNKDLHQTWVNRFLSEREMNGLMYSYVTSLHWSLTQFTPASMEVFPQNVYERSFNVVVIICALVVFSSFVSSITQAMTHIRNINARAVEQDTMIRHYFSGNNISPALASRVWHIVRQKRSQGGKRLRLEELPVLQTLPVRMRDELRQEVFSPLLEVHPLLRLYFRNCPAAMRMICKKAVTERSLQPGKELKIDVETTANGDIVVDKMVFVVAGSLEYHAFESEEERDSHTEEPAYARVCTGGWACEAALWANKATIRGHLLAAPGGTDLLLLDGDAFRSVALQHLDSADLLTKYSALFVTRFREALAAEEHQEVMSNILFNDPEEAKEMAKRSEAPLEQVSVRAYIRSFSAGMEQSGSRTTSFRPLSLFSISEREDSYGHRISLDVEERAGSHRASFRLSSLFTSSDKEDSRAQRAARAREVGRGPRDQAPQQPQTLKGDQDLPTEVDVEEDRLPQRPAPARDEGLGPREPAPDQPQTPRGDQDLPSEFDVEEQLASDSLASNTFVARDVI